MLVAEQAPEHAPEQAPERARRSTRAGRPPCTASVVMGTTATAGLHLLLSVLVLSLVGEAACRSAPPQPTSLSHERGYLSEAAASAAAAATAAAAARVLAIVGSDVDGEEAFAGVLAGLRARGFEVTLKGSNEKINMPLEEYGHLLLLADCTAGVPLPREPAGPPVGAVRPRARRRDRAPR